MTILLARDDSGHDDQAERYFDDIESALMAATIAGGTDATPERKRALLSLVLENSFGAAVAGYSPRLHGAGALSWHDEGTLRHLSYQSPTGLMCHLGRVYLQPNGTWAALVVAGVGMDEHEAMAKAEWAIARLTA